MIPHYSRKRVVVTGMSVITTIGDSLETVHNTLLQGKSGITRWKSPLFDGCHSKIGGDLSGYDLAMKTASLSSRIPAAVFSRMKKLVNNSPRPTALGILVAAEAFLDAGLFDSRCDLERIVTILAGSYMFEMFKQANWEAYRNDPDSVSSTLGVKEWDSDLSGCITEFLGLLGPSYSVGGVCAAGNVALYSALDQIRYHDCDIAMITAPTHELTPASMHSLALLGAISIDRFDEEPQRASRPFDLDRNGFIPGVGCATLVLEDLDHALRRGAGIYAEIAGVGLNSNASRSPSPVEERAVDVMERALKDAGIERQKIGYICAHATSTQLGDMAEVRAIERVFGNHAVGLKINSLKSMLGHQLSSSSTVETVAAILQMRHGVVYPTINIDRQDPDITLDVCANNAAEYRFDCLMKNAFGFGGVNSSCIIRRYE